MIRSQSKIHSLTLFDTVDLFDNELVNERSDLSKKNMHLISFDNTSMASGITLDSTFSNLLKDFIFVLFLLCVLVLLQ